MATSNHHEEQANLQEEMEREWRHYEDLYQQSLENMPLVKHYKVIRSHLKNMAEQQCVETIFAPADFSLNEVFKARNAAITFAEHLLQIMNEAKKQGQIDFETMQETVNEMVSLQDKTILSVHVNVVYQQLFTEVDRIDGDVRQSEEDTIYVPEATNADLDEMKEARKRETYSLKKHFS